MDSFWTVVTIRITGFEQPILSYELQKLISVEEESISIHQKWILFYLLRHTWITIQDKNLSGYYSPPKS